MVVHSKPISIAVIGWAWVVIATIMFADSLLSLLTQPAISSVIVGAVSVVYVIAAYRFLKLRSKAREMLEVLTWVALIALITMGLTQCTMIFILPTQIQHTEQIELGQFLAMSLIMVVGGTAVLAVPLIVILRFLRSASMIDVFQQNRDQQENKD